MSTATRFTLYRALRRLTGQALAFRVALRRDAA